MEGVLVAAICVLVVTSWLYTANVARSSLPTLRNKSILLLIAHPDDEAMFFAPTVLSLTREELGNHLKILCLSSGNAENVGEIRKKEIVKSASILGLRSEADVLVYEDADFPDSMTKRWDHVKIADVLFTFFSKSAAARKTPAGGTGRGEAPKATIDVLITFDHRGISSHPNHVSLYYGAMEYLRLLMKNKTGWECPVTLYTLTSTNIVRKYVSFLDTPLTMVSCLLQTLPNTGKKGQREIPPRIMCLSDFWAYRQAQKAMTEAHVSQMRWFRWGWIIVGRYMIVNDLKREKVV